FANKFCQLNFRTILSFCTTTNHRVKLITIVNTTKISQQIEAIICCSVRLIQLVVIYFCGFLIINHGNVLISLRIIIKRIIADHAHNINLANDVLPSLMYIPKLISFDVTSRNSPEKYKWLNTGGVIIALLAFLAMQHFIELITLQITTVVIGHNSIIVCCVT
ncbi:hypothetical protein DKK70_04030, partial [Gilliamella apicola]